MTNMEEILNNKLFQLLSFLITSARGCVDEPALYGPLRLLDASSRVIEIMERENLVDKKLLQIKDMISEALNVVMIDENDFIKKLDIITKELGEYISNLK